MANHELIRVGLVTMQVDAERLSNAEAWGKTNSAFGLSYDNLGMATAALDVLAIIATTVVTGALYHELVLGQSVALAIHLISGVAIAGFLVCFQIGQGGYAVERLLSPSLPIWSILLAWLLGVLVLLGAAFIAKVSSSFSRGALLTAAVLGPSVLVAQRTLLRQWFSSLFARGQLRARRIVLIGDRRYPFARARDAARNDYEIVRAFPVPVDGERLREVGERVLAYVHGSDVDEVHIAVEWQHGNAIKTLATELRALPLPVRLLRDRTADEILILAQPGTQFTDMVDLQRGPLTSKELHLKRASDVVLAAAALFLVAPFLLMIGLAIRLDSAGPVFFRQSRRGFNGRTFKIFKFRSMSVMEDGPVIAQAKANDARVTRVGRVLRKLSLDELPQLLNVLQGDMSLVGPRPHALAHDDEYTQVIEKYAFRQHMKPGITGWAQANGYRGETPTVEKMERRVEHDLWYIANWSMWLDLWIIVRTGLELLRSRNAH